MKTIILPIVKCWCDLMHQITMAVGIPQRLLEADPYRPIPEVMPLNLDQNKAAMPQDQGKVQEKQENPFLKRQDKR